MADTETLDGGWAPTREEAMWSIARDAVPDEAIVEVEEIEAVIIRQRLAEGSLGMRVARVVLLVQNTVAWDYDLNPILLGWSWSRIIKSE